MNMTHQKTKHTLVIDHDEQYVPIVRASTGEIRLSGNFSLAEQNTRSRERLERLIDFIRRHHNGDSVGVSHRLAAQVVYLAYWENYPLEFQIEAGVNIMVRAHFTRQSEFTFALDSFKDGLDPYFEIQGWWNFFCETISAHAEIWHIPLVVDESIYVKLTHGNYPRVQVDIVPNVREKG